MKIKTNENGFSLVELAVAAAVAITLSAITVSLLPGVINSMESKATAYNDCNTNKRDAAFDIIEGVEPSANQTVNGETSASYECKSEQKNLNDLKSSNAANGGN